jgi:hypothetical protein
VCELDEFDTIQVWSKIQVHGEEGGHEMMIKCSTLKRRKRKTKHNVEIKAKVLLRVLVLHSRHHRGCE